MWKIDFLKFKIGKAYLKWDSNKYEQYNAACLLTYSTDNFIENV